MRRHRRWVSADLWLLAREDPDAYVRELSRRNSVQRSLSALDVEQPGTLAYAYEQETVR